MEKAIKELIILYKNRRGHFVHVFLPPIAHEFCWLLRIGCSIDSNQLIGGIETNELLLGCYLYIELASSIYILFLMNATF